MKAGRLDRKITIEDYTITTNDYGEEEKTWSTWATVWAEKRDKKGREYFEQSGEYTEQQTVFKVRYRDGVKATMRIKYDGTTYDIVSVAELGRREGLELIAEVKQ